MHDSGFDIVIGNPPYVEYSKVKNEYSVRDYKTEECRNLYAFVMERTLTLLRQGGRCALIVPIASVSTEGMKQLQTLYNGYTQWHSHYAVRPGKLFVGVDMNLTITIIKKDLPSDNTFVTGYRRWSAGDNGDRACIFTGLAYVKYTRHPDHANPLPKLGSELEARILERMLGHGQKLGKLQSVTGDTLYYHSGGRYWRKALPEKLSSHYKPITVSHTHYPIVLALLNSQLFYWYWISNSNCMDVVSREVIGLPVFAFSQTDDKVLGQLTRSLMESYFSNNEIRQRDGERIKGEEVNFNVQASKPIIDSIDRVLAKHYGFTEEELDFIINYDIKYRKGTDSDADDE